MRPSKKTTIGLEVDRDLRDELMRLAQEDKRKLSAYVRIVLEQHVARKRRAA